MCLDEVLLESKLSLPLAGRGKVRDIYDLGDSLLFVASDRISAFDHVLGSGIPCKGRVLTGLSLFWFAFLQDVVPSHLITANMESYPRRARQPSMRGRSMLVKKAEMVPVECVARGYLAGSAYKEYKAQGRVCDIPLPPGLRDGDRLPEPIFTPATKAMTGHDVNVPFRYVANTFGVDLAGQLRDLTLDIYARAAAYAQSRGLILADTKFEFGFTGGELVLADEVLTPDSSRYWEAESHRPGGPQLSFDKQYVRDYLEASGWNKKAPAPALPEEVVRRTSQKYIDAHERITGQALPVLEDPGKNKAARKKNARV